MNIDKKTCINIGIVAFLLYLAIHYWDGLVGLFNLFLAAAGTLINGAIIAYVLNILMRFYERHMAPNTKKKVWNAMRRPVCMALAFLTLVAVIVALIQIILPQLISCVQVLLSSLPGVLRQMYDKLMENPTIAALMVDYNLVLPATEQEWREIIERAESALQRRGQCRQHGSQLHHLACRLDSLPPNVADFHLQHSHRQRDTPAPEPQFAAPCSG